MVKNKNKLGHISGIDSINVKHRLTIMKNNIPSKLCLNIATLSIIITFLSSCDESFEMPSIATFKEPQPKNKNTLNRFPSNLSGKYLSLADSSIINIQSNYITRVYDYWTVIKDSVSDKQIEYVGAIKNVSRKYYPIKGKDSVKLHFYSNDTLFFINNNHVVKSFKGRYFLNTKQEDTAWTVKQLSLEKHKLTLGGIASEEDLDKLATATSTPIDTTKTQNFQPSKKEFKTFIKNDGFSELEVFTKMK